MSAVLARRMEAAVQKKESAERYKGNLQRLQAEGAVTRENYDRMADGYEERLAEAATELAEVKALISQELDGHEKELAAVREELATLQARRSVGELSPQQFERSSRRLQKRIQALEANRDLCARLQLVTSTADLPSPSGASATVPDGAAGGRWKIAIPEPAAFTDFSSIEEMTTPRFKVVGLASGLLLLISVLANWVGSNLTIAGTDVSGWLLLVGLLGAVAAIYASLLVDPRARGFLHLAVAAAALLVFLAVLLALTFKNTSVFQVGGTRVEIGRTVLEFREGFYLYLVALAGMFYYGYNETKVK